MPNFRVLEVVSGLGMGGAEKALLSRLNYLPTGYSQSVLNIRPEIDSLKINPGVKEIRIQKKRKSKTLPHLYRYT